jgi:hypothetical protein
MNKFDLTAVPIGTLKVTRRATNTCSFAQWRRGCTAVSNYLSRLREQHRDIATAVFWKRRIGEAERCTCFTSEHCGGIIDPCTHRTLDYAHVQVRDLMKLPAHVKVGQPKTVTGGKRR